MPYLTPVEQTAPVTFLADRTVGKLARWLRILGYDTRYLPQLSPAGLVREGRRQGRIILTRNTRIRRFRDAPMFVFIEHDRFRDQLKQVVTALKLDPVARLLSRCVACNQPLEVADKNSVQTKVPAYTWQTQTTFHRCPRCRRVYWGATHREHVWAELRQLGLIEKEDRPEG